MYKKLLIVLMILIASFIGLGAIFKIGYDGVVSLEENTLGDKIGDMLSEDFKNLLKEKVFFVAKYKQDINALKKKNETFKEIIRQNNKIIYDKVGKIYYNFLYERPIQDNKNYNIRRLVTKNLFNGKNPYAVASAYIDIYDEKFFLISGDGNIFFNDKKELEEDNFHLELIKSNIFSLTNNEELNKNNFFGIKDLLVVNNKIIISYVKDIKEKCYNIELSIADLNYEYLKFSKLFGFEECSEKNPDISHSGGRIIKMDNENILFSIGDFNQREAVQNDNKFFGKIIKINLNTSDTSLISKGHRNPQGLYLLEDENILFSTEHGPIGGDEINIVNLNKIGNKNYNFGWPIASYGVGSQINPTNFLDTTQKYEKHSKRGFDEPLYYFTPSIGISELVVLNNKSKSEMVNIFVSSLGTAIWEGDMSLHKFKYDLSNEKIVDKEVIPINERIRDIKYDFISGKLYLFLESGNWHEGSSSIAIISSDELIN